MGRKKERKKDVKMEKGEKMQEKVKLIRKKTKKIKSI